MKTPFLFLVLAVLSLGYVLMADSDARPNDYQRRALVLAVSGAPTFSKGATHRADLIQGMHLFQGAEIVTGPNSSVDLFFNQIGSMVRVEPNSKVTLETLRRFVKPDRLVRETVFNLEEGRLLGFSRILVPDGKFVVKTKFGTVSMVGPSATRYSNSADGSVVVGKKSPAPLQVESQAGSGKTNLVQPSQKLQHPTNDPVALDDATRAKITTPLDSLQSLAETLAPPSMLTTNLPPAEKKAAPKR